MCIIKAELFVTGVIEDGSTFFRRYDAEAPDDSQLDFFSCLDWRNDLIADCLRSNRIKTFTVILNTTQLVHEQEDKEEVICL